jgi:O-antigen ligase
MRSGNSWPAILGRWCAWLLLYLPPLGMVGALVFMISKLKQGGAKVWPHPPTWMLVVLTGLFLASTFTSSYRQESLIQLVNYLPFFAYYLAWSTWQPSPTLLARFATDLVLAALPVNLMALLEFGIKLGRKLMPEMSLQVWGWPALAEPNRAVAIFNHPNFLASYMVLIFGLGLGVSIHRQYYRSLLNLPAWLTRCLYVSTGLSFIGIVCAGSRNALAVAVGQLLVASWCWQGGRWWRWLIWSGIGGIGVLALGFGVGGRRLSLDLLQQDPRFGLWQIAADLIQQHPWLGWGLGSFKFLYPARKIDPTYLAIAHPHNFWMMIAAEAGLPAMILLSLMVGYLAYRAVRLLRQQTAQAPLIFTYLICLCGNSAYALFDTTLFDARINLINWTTLAVLNCLVAATPKSSS